MQFFVWMGLHQEFLVVCWQISSISYGFRDILDLKRPTNAEFQNLNLKKCSFNIKAVCCKMIIFMGYWWTNQNTVGSAYITVSSKTVSKLINIHLFNFSCDMAVLCFGPHSPLLNIIYISKVTDLWFICNLKKFYIFF